MKIIYILLILIFSAFAAFAQIERAAETTKPAAITEVYLAKDDGEGAAGAAAEIFQTTDVPIYCVVQLDSLLPALVKMNLVAVSVKNVKPESRVVSISYKTDGKQDRVNFTGKPDGLWTAGNYRVDVFLDGVLSQSKSFEIKKAVNAPANTAAFVTKPALKPARRARKNR